LTWIKTPAAARSENEKPSLRFETATACRVHDPLGRPAGSCRRKVNFRLTGVERDFLGGQLFDHLFDLTENEIVDDRILGSVSV
jgi:hypothetical protein